MNKYIVIYFYPGGQITWWLKLYKAKTCTHPSVMVGIVYIYNPEP